MPPKRKVTESVKKSVAAKQRYKCATIPDFDCPLWKVGDGTFDESGYEIDHVHEHSMSHDDGPANLQALCLSCHRVKTKRFMQQQPKKPRSAAQQAALRKAQDKRKENAAKRNKTVLAFADVCLELMFGGDDVLHRLCAGLPPDKAVVTVSDSAEVVIHDGLHLENKRAILRHPRNSAPSLEPLIAASRRVNLAALTRKMAEWTGAGEAWKENVGLVHQDYFMLPDSYRVVHREMYTGVDYVRLRDYVNATSSTVYIAAPGAPPS